MERVPEGPKRKVTLEDNGNSYVYSCTPELTESDLPQSVLNNIGSLINPDGGFILKLAQLLKVGGGSGGTRTFLSLLIPKKTPRDIAVRVFNILRNAGIMDYTITNERYYEMSEENALENKLREIARSVGGKVSFTLEVDKYGNVIREGKTVVKNGQEIAFFHAKLPLTNAVVEMQKKLLKGNPDR